jgi:hypothetical protein
MIDIKPSLKDFTAEHFHAYEGRASLSGGRRTIKKPGARGVSTSGRNALGPSSVAGSRFRCSSAV